MWWSLYVVIVIFIYQWEAMYWGLNITCFSSHTQKQNYDPFAQWPDNLKSGKYLEGTWI